MFRKILSTTWMTTICLSSLFAQEITIGTIYNSEEAFDGYTLFAPFNSFSTYLVDNCGRLVNEWESDFRLSASVYLLDDGSIIRTAKIPGDFIAGGFGGRLEQFNWEGELIWAFEYSNDTFQLHHDIEILPNGNILAIAWEKKTAEEAADKGKLGPVGNQGLWSEQIIEIQRGGNLDGEIIWKWHVWDHLIQNSNPTLDNFGFPKDHPRRIDINFSNNEADWIHLNAIDYNADLDQIVLSSRNFNELWVIDHSTTIEEAQGSSGGNAGLGGDLLYRWGNPASYGRGTNFDRLFFNQHDVRWINSGTGVSNQIMAFNNGESQSSVIILETDLLEDGGYHLPDSDSFGPHDFTWEYSGPENDPFYSATVSGADLLPNGNILIAVGEDGRCIEIDETEAIVWEYIVPTGNFSVLSQGDIPNANEIFRAEKFSKFHPAFSDKDVTDMGFLEMDPIEDHCSIFTSVDEPNEPLDVYIQPNLVASHIGVASSELPLMASIYTIDGTLLMHHTVEQPYAEIDCTSLTSGMYIIRFESKKGSSVHRFIKA